nr:reverse transcriptase domain-containing protein [Tanacetum cinerariifolium]
MRTRNSYIPNNSSATIPRRRNKRRTPNVVEPELRTIVEMADNHTMDELLQAPTQGYGEAIVIPEINADHFEIKTNLLQLVQANPYHGFERENPYTHINNFKRITSTLKFRDVPNYVIKLMMFSYSLEGNARVWYDKEPPNSILTWEDLLNKFVNQFFPPSKTTHLKNEISRFTKRFEETFGEAWERFKKMLRACPHHGFTKLANIDTFYNGLNDNDQDSLNVAAGGNLLCKTTREALQIIENKSKVRYSRNKPNVSRMNTTSRENVSKMDDRIDELADQISTLVDIFSKKVVTPALVKAVEESCVTCGGAHAYYNCPNTITNQPSVCVATGTYNQVAPQNRASNFMAPPGFALVQNGQNRFNDEKLREKAMNQMEKFFQIFQDFHFDISFADALLLMPKFASTIKSLLTNKDKLFELAKIPLNENCIAMLLKKLPEKLGDTGKFLIPCDFPRMDVCHALADLGESINLMPLSTWKKLSLPELTPTRMTLELADRSITRPKGVAEDVFVKVGKFHFLTDFVVVDFEADPRVSLILGRSFLRTDHALIDVYGEEITLRVNDEAVTFNLNQTTRYSSTYDDLSVNRIDIIDVAREESAQESLGFSNNSSGGNPTSTFEHILSDSSPSLTPFEGSDFILEEIDAYLKDESISLEIYHANCNPEGADKLPMIIAKDLKVDEKEALLKVSPIHCVPKKGGITVVENENNELIPTRLVTEWRVCIDYRKLNDATRKDHFPLLFMDQMLERLAGKELYWFLDGFSGYFQILINPPDKENTTFTCPYRTFAYRRMPFGLCNAPETFQRCMMAIFHDMIEKTMEVFMDYFFVFGDSFSSCLSHLDTMLQRFIQDFSKIARPMTHLLEKETPFVFSKDCIDAFETLKNKLTEAPILIVPDWNLPFELMCDANDFVIGVVLGKRIDFMGPFPSSRGNRYILVVVDYLSKWVEAKALPTNDARVVVKFLKSLFPRFRTLRAIISDRGTHFVNDKFAKVTSKYGVTHRLSTTYHPQTSGQVEVLNRGLKRILERTVGENRALWSKKLNDALWAFKTAYKTPIGCTPYKLVYGKYCHLPIELEHKTYWALKYVNFDLKTAGDHRKLQLNELNELRDQAYESSLIYKEKTKKIHDSKIKNRIFNVGDRVLLFNSRLNIFSGKLKTHWSGPFTITKVFPYGTVELS